MTSGVWAAIAGLAAVALALVKYFLSGDAAKAQAEAAFQAAEKARQDQVASQVQADQQNAATASQGANAAEDAALDAISKPFGGGSTG